MFNKNIIVVALVTVLFACPDLLAQSPVAKTEQKNEGDSAAQMLNVLGNVCMKNKNDFKQIDKAAKNWKPIKVNNIKAYQLTNNFFIGYKPKVYCGVMGKNVDKDRLLFLLNNKIKARFVNNSKTGGSEMVNYEFQHKGFKGDQIAVIYSQKIVKNGMVQISYVPRELTYQETIKK